MALPIVPASPPRQTAPCPPAALGPLPTVAKLEQLFADVMRRPLWLPPRLGRYMALRRRMSLRQLDPQRVRIVTPKGKINDCAACTDSCCLGGRNTVLLRLRDVASLIDIGRSELMTKDKPVFSDHIRRARPALGRVTQSLAWQVMPILRQHAYGACMALNDEGRCTLYPHWPLSCARFPLSLDVDSEEIFFAERCRSFWIHPSEAPRAQRMSEAAVASYNERIKDAILLSFALPQLHDLGLTNYLSL